MAATPTYFVTCKQCGRTLARTERLRDPEIAALETHIRACAPSEPLADAPMLGEIMARVRVAPLERA